MNEVALIWLYEIIKMYFKRNYLAAENADFADLTLIFTCFNVKISVKSEKLAFSAAKQHKIYT